MSSLSNGPPRLLCGTARASTKASKSANRAIVTESSTNSAGTVCARISIVIKWHVVNIYVR